MSLVNAPVSYKRGLFTIHRKKMSSWQGHNMNPGFSVTITYSDGEVQDPEGSAQLSHETTIGHDIIGITRDFQMTPALARLLRDNHALVSRGTKKVKRVMQAYQAHYRHEAQHKDATLSYDFFINVYDNPTLKRKDLEALVLATEENPKVRFPSTDVTLAIDFLYERMAAVNRTRIHQWWYLFWDDLYRKNHEEIPQLTPKEFSPAFPGSICYRPMPRQELESFLEKHGCWQKSGRAGFMHIGVLNRMYTFMNELVFERMSRDQRMRQLELSTVERQRLENLFLVTKAKVHNDGTYKRLPLSEYEENDHGATQNTDNQSLGRKPSMTSLGRTKSKKGWFESITPGRRLKVSSRLESYSPGYIIPQTWQQKASQFTALLIGGRSEDMIGDSDEEDDMNDDEDIAQKERKGSASSLETSILQPEKAGETYYKKTSTSPGHHQQTELSDKSKKRLQKDLQQPMQRPKVSLVSRPESWASVSTCIDNDVTHGTEEEELVPLTSNQQQDLSSRNQKLRTRDEDAGMASDCMSVASMSSEDYW
ncbi:hypothetical protein BX616_003700 [Lobosporangium transversale]|nr:hypothetical protein BX616_003700 [Lobosporangium transversale]